MRQGRRRRAALLTHPLRRRVLFSGFYSQKKGGNPSLSVGVLFFLGFQSDDLFTGVVAPTTCSLTTCLTTCMVIPFRRSFGALVIPFRRTFGTFGDPV